MNGASGFGMICQRYRRNGRRKNTAVIDLGVAGRVGDHDGPRSDVVMLILFVPSPAQRLRINVRLPVMVADSGFGFFHFGDLLDDRVASTIVFLLRGVLHVAFVYLRQVEKPFGRHADRSSAQLWSRRTQLNSGHVVAATQAGRVSYFSDT